MRCASLHRKLGTHISKVKSLSMDSWSNEQVDVTSAASCAEALSAETSIEYEAQREHEYQQDLQSSKRSAANTFGC